MKKSLLEKFKELITLLNSLPRNQRKSLLQQFKKTHISCISEIFKNLIKNKIPLDPKIFKKYKNEIKSLACKKIGFQRKKKYLLSIRGGNLLGIILPLAVNIISRLFNKS